MVKYWIRQEACVLGVVSKEKLRGGKCRLVWSLREGDPSKLTHDTVVGHPEAMDSTQTHRNGGAFPLKKGTKDPSIASTAVNHEILSPQASCHHRALGTLLEQMTSATWTSQG